MPRMKWGTRYHNFSAERATARPYLAAGYKCSKARASVPRTQTEVMLHLHSVPSKKRNQKITLPTVKAMSDG